jgi:hypothetical protein
MDNMVYQSGGVSAASPVSLRTDWTRFYFSLGEGTGQEGTLAKIYSYDNAANTLTLDAYIPASSVTVYGNGGVQSGFFNCTVRNNTITGAVGANNTYATAISAYLNVFGMKIENNMVSGCAHGINLAGGSMITPYNTLAWNNTISGNQFLNCDQVSATADPSDDLGVVRIISYKYGADKVIQYGNKFINNTVIGGRIFIENQANFIFEGNVLKNTTTKVAW